MITFRPAEEKDAERLLQIYAPYVINTAITFEYEVPSLEDFKNRIVTISQHFPYIVAIKDNQIAGYAYAGVFHEREAYKHSCELSIYVDQSCHGQGIGTALYQELEKQLLERDITVLYACIAATSRNPDKYLTDASQLFHAARGFTFAGKFKCCALKFNQWYDMVYMEKHLTKKEFKDPEATKEVMDLFTKNHTATGLTKIRSEKAPEGFMNQIVHVCIFNSEDKMLIQQRSATKKSWTNLWDFSIGGHVDAGETPSEAAQRELEEELGIKINLADTQSHFTINFDTRFDDYFIVHADESLENLNLQVSEVKAVQYADAATIKRMIIDGTFIPYRQGLVDFLFSMKDGRGAHTI